MAIAVTVRDEKARSFLKKLNNKFRSGEHIGVLNRVALKSMSRLIQRTPKGFTGLTRQKWTIIKVSGRGYIVTNSSKVMLFLERGTKAHGPVTAKFLYIPLNRAAAIGGWHPGLQIGADYVLARRVRGIRAMNIVQSERPIILASLRQEMIRFIREIV